MTRKEMEQCRTLRQEIKSIESAMRSPHVQDVIVFYKDYRTGYSVPKVKQENDGGENDLKILRKNLQLCKDRLAKQLIAAEEYIESIEDGRVRTVFRYYYLAGMSQEKIASELFCDQSRISQIINAYWMEQLQAEKDS